MKYLMKKISLTGAFILVIFSAISYSRQSYSEISVYSIRCGYGNTKDGYFNIVKQTTKIPYITKDDNPNYYFGCNVISPNNVFTANAEITPPYLDKFSSPNEYSINKDKHSIIIAPVTGSDQADVKFRLDNGDPQGVYIVKIYINKALYRIISFDVSTSYNN